MAPPTPSRHLASTRKDAATVPPSTFVGTVSIEELVDCLRSCSAIDPRLVMFENTNVVTDLSLTGDDPVTQLHCLTAPPSITAIGLSAGATVSSSTSDLAVDSTTRVIHVLRRDGCSVTVLFDEANERWFGPTTQPQQGRLPDVCRRIFDLRTAPVTIPMIDFVIAAWLEVITRHALATPALSWEDIVGLHPVTQMNPPTATPSSMADATRTLGAALDWERFRSVIAAVGGFPFGDDAQRVAEWMDDGMFSRWAMELLPTQTEALRILDACLGPSAYDRLWATISLCSQT